MLLESIILDLDQCQKELTQTLVDGGEDSVADNKIRGAISGLEKAKAIIYQKFEEQTLNDGISENEDE